MQGGGQSMEVFGRQLEKPEKPENTNKPSASCDRDSAPATPAIEAKAVLQLVEKPCCGSSGSFRYTCYYCYTSALSAQSHIDLKIATLD